MKVICDHAGKGTDGCKYVHIGKPCEHSIPHEPDNEFEMCLTPDLYIEVTGEDVVCRRKIPKKTHKGE